MELKSDKFLSASKDDLLNDVLSLLDIKPSKSVLFFNALCKLNKDELRLLAEAIENAKAPAK